MDLALEAGVSPRHLSFIETGRSRPSPETLLALAQCLDVPLRERNHLLLAAGFAPRYSERSIAEIQASARADGADAELAAVRQALEQILAAHDPMPGLVLDRQWNVVLANRSAGMLTQLLPPALREPPINVFRASLHPEGLARFTENLTEWADYLVATLRRAVQRAGDPALAALMDEVLTYPSAQAAHAKASEASGGMRADRATAPVLLVPCVLALPIGRVRLFTTLTTFGTPRDITLDELCIELFYPADAESGEVMRRATTAPPAEEIR
jgi:transcriptional regulator with XRE-family HTH domain